MSPARLGPLPLLEAGSGPASRAPTPESQEEPVPAPLFNDERTPLNHRVIQRLKSRPHNLGASALMWLGNHAETCREAV